LSYFDYIIVLTFLFHVPNGIEEIKEIDFLMSH
jgi:hypothetical protein